MSSRSDHVYNHMYRRSWLTKPGIPPVQQVGAPWIRKWIVTGRLVLMPISSVDHKVSKAEVDPCHNGEVFRGIRISTCWFISAPRRAVRVLSPFAL